MNQEVQQHNETVLSDLDPGDMIEFPRGRLYSHYGVYAGRGKVIHLSGENDGIGDGLGSGSTFTICGEEFNKAHVKEDDFFEVAGNSKAKKSNRDHKKNPVATGWEIVGRAREKLGEIGYNVLWKNCEHFAAWCRYDVNWSEQVDKALTWGTIGIAVAGLAAVAVGMTRSRNRQGQS